MSSGAIVGSYQTDFTSQHAFFAAVPEPTVMAALGMVSVGLLARRRTR